MRLSLESVWCDVVRPPVTQRNAKPRRSGVTMVIDKGLGVEETGDLLRTAGAYLDLLKLGFGTALLYDRETLRSKIRLAHAHDVLIYPGGTLFEIAVLQNRALEYIERVAELGFGGVEVSEGTIDLDPRLRRVCIERGIACGLTVLSEVGKKDPTEPFDIQRARQVIEADLDSGSDWVIIEGRDSGRGVGVYDAQGRLREALAEELLICVSGCTERIILEAPQVAQQNEWLLRMGPNANFGNVQPGDVIALEATRQALRGDTLRSYVERR